MPSNHLLHHPVRRFYFGFRSGFSRYYLLLLALTQGKLTVEVISNSSPEFSSSQSSLPGFCPVMDAVNALSRAGIEKCPALFTRREVADPILDLVGYTDDQLLHKRRLLKPSFGKGDLPLSAVERLPVKLRRRKKFSELSEMMSLKTFVTAFAGHIASEAAR